MAFPEIPYQSKHALDVQMLDGAMKRMNVTRDKGAGQRDINNQQQAALRPRQIKAAFVLENTSAAEVQTNKGARRQNGPLIVFVTGSIGRLIDADTSDVMRYPFLKLVAPEDMLCVSRFFERLGETADVLFETFSLLQQPHIIDGDVVVADAQNTRVVVECLGANMQDDMALLLRKLRSQAPPTIDAMGNYVRPKIHELDEDGGYMTLSEIISDDPETSDAGEWSRLLWVLIYFGMAVISCLQTAINENCVPSGER